MSADGRSYLRNRKFLKRAREPADVTIQAQSGDRGMNALLANQRPADTVSEVANAEAEQPRRSLRVATRRAQSEVTSSKERSDKRVSFVTQ